ncbi:MAG: adenylate/guanylate cyclase domain-containing protein [Betaproteobacteria bacterium]
MASESPLPVEEWLRLQGLGQYAALFAENAIDHEILPTLSESDLRSIGLPLGHARKLALAAAKLNPAQSPSPLPEPAPAPAVEPERRQLTVMFCDLVGSTALSSRLDPEDLRTIIQRYQKTCADVVARYGGFLAQYLGDGILVYFGYPQAQEDAAERAVRTGLEIIAAVNQLDVPATAQIQVRIGVATGLAVVGDLIGRGASAQAAVIGQTPNLAARIQSLAEPGCMTIAESTRKLVGNLFEYRDLGLQRLKGIDGEVGVLQVVGERQNAARFESIRQTGGDCVGRQREVDFLLEKWRATIAGDGQIVLAWGEAGIGKSRLLRQLNKQLEGESLIRVNVQCSPQHLLSPLYPIISSNQRFMGLRPEESVDEKLDKIEQMLAVGNQVEKAPLLAALMSVPTTGRYPSLTLTAEEQKEQTLQMCVDFVLDMASRQPVLYQVEDAHWIDPTTEELLTRLVAQIPRHRIFLLVTGRPECRPPWLDKPNVSLLDLGRLGETEIRLMVQSIAGKALPEAVISQILAKTDGVPLFVEELTRTVLESGLLHETGECWELNGPLPPMAIPLTLQDSLMARLDRLSSAKEVVQVASAIGRSFSYAMLAAVMDTPESQLRTALERLFKAGLIFPRGEPPGAEYWFKHALVQDAAYESLLRSRRAVLHARIVRAMETHFAETLESQPELLAHHAARADLTEKAITYGLQAGRRALARSANREAMQLLGTAIELTQSLPDEKTRLEAELNLQLALGQACLALHGYAAHETAEVFGRARELAERVDKPQQYYAMLYGLYANNVINGRLNLADDLAQRFLERASQEGDRGHRCIGHRMVGVVAFYRGQLGSALEHQQQAIAQYDATLHRKLALRFGTDIGVTAQIYLGWIESILGRHETAARHVAQAIEQARGIEHALSLGQAFHTDCVIAAVAKNYPALLTASRTALQFCEKNNLGYYLFWARNFNALAESMLSGPEKFAPTRRSFANLSEFNKTVAAWWFHSWTAEILLLDGKPEQAMLEIDAATTLIAANNERWGQAEIERIHGECLLAMPFAAIDEAEHWLRNAVASAKAVGALTFELRAAQSLYRLLTRSGRAEEGMALLAPICGQFTEGLNSAELLAAKAIIGG